jgi:chromosome partitioning protein
VVEDGTLGTVTFTSTTRTTVSRAPGAAVHGWPLPDDGARSARGLGWPLRGGVAVEAAHVQAVLADTLVSRETLAPGAVSRETTAAEMRDVLAASIPEAGADTPLAQSLAADTRRRLALTGRQLPAPPATRVLTVANQKGGVGKTTTTVNIAAALAQSGLKVLVVDLDPQGNASTALGVDHHAEVPSVYDVLVDGKAFAEVVVPCPTVEGLFCAPATIDLAGAEIELVSMVAREMRLGRALATHLRETDLDYVLIDCPPSLGLLTINAFVAASEVFIPIQCEYYALEGLSQLLKNIELIRAHLNPDLHVSTILLTMYDGRTRLSSQVADEVRTHFPDQVLRTSVPRSVRVSEAPSFGETVMTYDPTSSGALSYLEAAGELADRGAVTPAATEEDER